ncbi:GDSL esterase/lipase 7-like [Hibiscus syriacus]|uniref:GDSL esterase/lipase 7-like n=1 Tax=Hibiscus syriacus TaxID=106335 RepID=UPI0019231120|nr:GDSL esterase/lipase 7-like [Hibiscus syriacus]
MNYVSLCFLALFLLPLGSFHTDSKRLPPLPVPPFNIPQAEICRYLGLDYRSINLPALYVFGDSFIDAGNNNYLDTTSKANYAPYGIDFGGVATGRPTNGRTVVDFIAQVVGLPFPPPVMGLSGSQRKITTGLNYGSSSGGILPLPSSLAPIFGHVLSFDEQIQLFNHTVSNLKGQFHSLESFDSYMSSSLFFVHIGGNDLALYRELGKLHEELFSVKKYTLLLSNELYSRLEAMYELGARKFVVNNAFPFGCQPVNLHQKTNDTSFLEDMNERAALFNGRLHKILRKLNKSLKGSTFVLFDMYKLFEDVLAQPATYGFTNINDSCCIDVAGDQSRTCLPSSVPCADRKSHVFFDPFHPSESIHFLWFRRLFQDNLLDLIQS